MHFREQVAAVVRPQSDPPEDALKKPADRNKQKRGGNSGLAVLHAVFRPYAVVNGDFSEPVFRMFILTFFRLLVTSNLPAKGLDEGL